MLSIIKNTTAVITVAFLAIQCSPKTTDSAMADKMEKEMPMAKEDIHAFRATAPTPGAAPKINIGKANTFELKNGLKVIVVENHKVPQISYQVSLVNEPILEGDKVGYVSMAGDILARGTTSKSKAEIDEAVDFIGANFNTSASGMFASSLTKHSDKLLNLLTDVLYNPSFPAAELEKIKTQSISNIESSKSDPNSMMGNVRAVINYGKDHPYGEIQTKQDVENIGIADLKQYYENYFVPNNAYLIVVGDIDPATAKANAEKYFGDWKRKAVKPTSKRSAPAPNGTHVKFAHKDAAVQSVINITYPLALTPGAPDVIPSRVMNTILGGGFSSRLMQNLREDKAYTYGSRSSISSDAVTGSFNATASVRNEVTDSSVYEILNELTKLNTELVSDEELQSIKNYMTGGFARGLESPRTVARFAYNIFRYNLPADYYETYLEKLNAVTKEDIMAMAKKYVRPENANIVVVGNKDDVAESLLKFDSDGVLEYFDAFGDDVNFDIELPADVSVEQIIGDYIDAIGGEAALAKVNSVYSQMKASAMGQELTINSYQEGGNKFAMDVGMSGMVMQSSIFDGTTVKVTAQGQDQMHTEGPMFDQMSGQSKIIPQRSYATDGSELTLSGIEDIDGVKAYKVSVKSASGQATTEYYAIDNGFLVRSVTSPQPGMTVTSDYSEYKEVSGGVMYPYTTKVSGMMPIPLEMKIAEIEINGEIPADTFKVK